jgi:hypothetical protein
MTCFFEGVVVVELSVIARARAERKERRACWRGAVLAPTRKKKKKKKNEKESASDILKL